MGNEQRQILTMLKEGKITVDEAEKLLAAIRERTEAQEPAAVDAEMKKKMKYLRITEDREPREGQDQEKHVNIRIPLVLLRAGAKFHSLLPDNAREKLESALKDKLGAAGMNLLESDNMEAIAKALGEEGISIEIDQPHKKIRVFCE